MAFQKYSEDIKLLAVRMAQKNRRLTNINRFLGRSISSRSLLRWEHLYRRTNKVIRNPEEYDTRGRNHVLSDDHLAFLYDLINTRPSMYLDDLQKQLELFTGIQVSQSTISRELHKRLGLSLLVTRGVHKDQSAIDPADFVFRVAGIPPEYLVFIDECGIVGPDCDRERSWAPRGGQTVRQERLSDRDHWTLLPAVCEQGMLAGVAVKGPVERVHVELFLKHDLMPVMNPYPGPNSVLILDNARIHHGGLIEEFCEEHGVLLIYLPAYSPDFNPIEKSFHCTKCQLKREQRWAQTVDKAAYILNVAGRVITRSLMQPLITNSGYTTRHYWLRYNEAIGI